MEFSAKQIAQVIQGTIEGDENATVHTFAKIEEGQPGAISFLSNPKYTQKRDNICSFFYIIPLSDIFYWMIGLNGIKEMAGCMLFNASELYSHLLLQFFCLGCRNLCEICFFAGIYDTA